MPAIDFDEMKKKLGLDDIVKSVNSLTEKQRREQELKEKAAKEAEELERMRALVNKAIGDEKEDLQKALDLVQTMDAKSKESAEIFAKAMEAQQEEIIGLKDQIKSLLIARDNGGVPTFLGDRISKALYGKEDSFEEEVEKLVLLSYVMQKNVFETAHGEAHLKAVNSSSSIQVSSESYETIFSMRILRDVQKQLVVGTLFEELPMTSKALTMMVEPESGKATWVEASTYGTDATTGTEDKTALTEITFKTYKLAAKAYMTDETEEDAIFTLLPIMRRRLVEAHAIAIEEAFMSGDGTAGKPTGLLKYAETDGKKKVTLAKADGSVKVTALEIHKLRRELGRHGINLNKLVLIVSMDAYYDLLEDQEFQDVAQVGAADAVKLQGQVGRLYGMPVVVSEYFPAKAVSKEYCVIVYRENFVMPRQRDITVEKERQAGKQRDAYYVTQRVNLQRFFANGVVTGTYAAS